MDIDYYSGDTSGNGDYDDQVTGILKESDSSVSTAKAGALSLASSASNGFLKDAGDKVFAGNKGNGATVDDLEDDSVPSTVRSNTVWYLDITDTREAGGLVDIAINPSAIGLDVTSDAGTYELIWRAAESGAFEHVAFGREIANGQVLFRNLLLKKDAGQAYVTEAVNKLTDGYITLAHVDTTPPGLRYAEITDANEITVTFDEAITVTGTAFSSTTTTISAATLHPDAPNKVVLTTGATTPRVETLTYTGLNIQDVASHQLTALPDIVVGTSEADIIVLTGASIVIADASNDTITASSGADIFDYNFITDGNDTINGFAVGTDKIDLSDLLQYSNEQEISKFIAVTSSGGNTTLSIDAHGKGNTTAATATQRDIAITLIGVTATLKDLMDNGNLILTPQ